MRKKSIESKLNFAYQKYQELLSELFESKLKGKRLPFVSHVVEEILANTTECFDYTILDLYEKYIPLHGNVYFPFSLKILNNKEFQQLKIKKHIIYDFLFKLTEKIERQELIPSTTISYSISQIVRKLVNEKKHNNIIEVNRTGTELIASSEFGEITIVKTNIPLEKIVLFKDAKHRTQKLSKGFYLTDKYKNEYEVGDLCLNALVSTKIIVDEIYRKFLGTKIETNY